MIQRRPSDSDEEFPLGDGTVETEAEVVCPYCAETSVIAIDPGSGASQQYSEDCPVCCNPWQVRVCYEPSGAVRVTVERID